MDRTSRIALVTGGGSGIGRASALALADDGWQVVIAGRRAAPLEEVAAERPGAITTHVADVTDVAAVHDLVAAVLERHGRLDLLFNNAGRFDPAGEPDAVEPDAWRAILDTNVTGTFLCTREAFRVMREQSPQGGRIINNGSISAHAPRPGSIAYTTTKHAVTGMTKATALDGRAYSISAGQIDVGNASDADGAEHVQPDGERMTEPTMPYAEAGAAVAYMAARPLDVDVLHLTVMARDMPFVGRG